MALVRWQATVQDDNGNAVVNPSITVRNAATNALASIYDDAGVAKSNPFIGGADGFVSFKANPGRYTVEGASGAQVADDWTVDLVSSSPIDFATRADFISALSWLNELDAGMVVSAGGLQYVKTAGATDIADAQGWLPFGEVDWRHFGFTGAGTLADTAKAQAAIDYASPGKSVLRKPGTYLLANTNPYPSATYPGVSESDANWWANRRALWIWQDNTHIEIGHGVILKVADGEDCHAIQIGQFSLDAVSVPDISVHNCSIVGYGAEIDMNGANQTVATASKDHPGGIMVNHGSSRIRVQGFYVHDSSYYGVAFEGGVDDENSGFTDCLVSDLKIENCKADGFDAKDFDTNSARNVIERVSVTNCGDGGAAFLSEQAGIDLRGGWTCNDCSVTYTDGYASGRVGFRAQYAPTYDASPYPTSFNNCKAITSGKVANTIGFRVSGKNAEVTNCMAVGFNEAIRVSAPYTRVRGFFANGCYFGFRALNDSGAGWDADASDFIDGKINDCDVAWRVDSGVTAARIIGGSITGIATPLVDNGTNTRIWGVNGFATRSSGSVAVPVGVAGLVSVDCPHSLLFTPALSDIQVTEQRSSNVSDYALNFLRVVSVDGAKTTIEAYVKTASATPSASFLARVVIRSKEP